jgi:methionine synthase II (cobalamin-independent)
MPGTDIVEAVKTVLGELPALPHLPELPARGPGADMIGRGAGLLTDLPVEVYAGRWRVATHAGRDLRRTLDLWDRDLDVLTESGAGYAGPIKVQAPGPWTLAASLDLPIGGAVLHDHGATRDLAASLADGLRRHVLDVATRLPGAAVTLQLDEPSLPAVLAGEVPTESGLRTLRAVSADVARAALISIVEAVGVPVVVHCCAVGAPIGLMRSAGAAGVSVDMSLLGTGGLDEVGELIDAGLALFAGAVPATGAQPPSAEAVAASLTGVWRRLGFAPALLPAQVVVTPACGLAGATPGYARSALAVCVEAARRLAEA